MVEYVKKIWAAVDLKDGVAAVGLALVASGIGVIFWPAALITVGVALLYVTWAGVKRGNPR